jgi:hypothetical protein
MFYKNIGVHYKTSMSIICVNNYQVLNLPPFIYIFPYHYKYMHDLAILSEDADGVDLGSSARPDQSNF